MRSIEKKYNKLRKQGFKEKTLNSLTESQLDSLFLLMNEQQIKQTTRNVKQTTTTIPGNQLRTQSGVNVNGVNMKQDGGGNVVTTTVEGELGEEKKNNPWAICTSTISKKAGTSKRSEWGKEHKKAFEACVKDVKKAENKLHESIKNEIRKIVEAEFKPEITKGELIKLMEQGTKEAPTREKEKEKEKRRWHPGRDPRPGDDPAPKMSASSEEEEKDEIIKMITKILGGE